MVDKDTTHDVSLLMQSIQTGGKIALSDIWWPFVWQPSRVRGLFDSKYTKARSATCCSLTPVPNLKRCRSAPRARQSRDRVSAGRAS